MDKLQTEFNTDKREELLNSLNDVVTGKAGVKPLPFASRAAAGKSAEKQEPHLP